MPQSLALYNSIVIEAFSGKLDTIVVIILAQISSLRRVISAIKDNTLFSKDKVNGIWFKIRISS